MSLQIDSVWTIDAALLLYFMHGGFGFYEAGMCHMKNTVDTLTHNLMILAVTIPVYWAVGFALMYGRGNGFMGLDGFLPQMLTGKEVIYPALLAYPVPLAVAFAYAGGYADTPATLIAGTGAERIHFAAVMLLTVLISGFLFPVVGHWLVGGGWLSQLRIPVYDTGSGLVQLCGGCCALAVALVLGPRRGERSDGKSARQHQVSSMPLVFLGAFILWLGFLAFNTGFAMKVSRLTGLIVVNTVLAGAAGTIMALAGAWVMTGKARLRTAIVGLLTANVAVTSTVSVVEPWAATGIGAAAGLITAPSMALWSRLRLDDPTEYLTMNVVGGVMGMGCVGVFASPAVMRLYAPQPAPHPGLLYGGGPGQFYSQLLGAGAVVGFIVPCMIAACLMLRTVGWLRVPRGEERRGQDASTHGEKAYENEHDGGDEHDGGRRRK